MRCLIVGMFCGGIGTRHGCAGDSRLVVVLDCGHLAHSDYCCYDRVLKANLGRDRFAMGSLPFSQCAFGNECSSNGPWTAAHWIVAGGIGLYIVGVTWFARREAATSQTGQLSVGTLTCCAGMLQCWWWLRDVVIERACDRARFYPSQSRSWRDSLARRSSASIGWRFVRAIMRTGTAHGAGGGENRNFGDYRVGRRRRFRRARRVERRWRLLLLLVPAIVCWEGGCTRLEA